MKTSADTTRPARPGDIVRLDGHRGAWKVLSIYDGIAHLTKLSAHPRIDLHIDETVLPRIETLR